MRLTGGLDLTTGSPNPATSWDPCRGDSSPADAEGCCSDQHAPAEGLYNGGGRFRCVPTGLFVALLLAAQATLGWEQLRSLVQSSVKLQQRDKEVAAYLRKQKL